VTVTAQVTRKTDHRTSPAPPPGRSASSSLKRHAVDVAEEFNRYNTRRLVIEDPDLYGFHISGVFSSTDPQSSLAFCVAVPAFRSPRPTPKSGCKNISLVRSPIARRHSSPHDRRTHDDGLQSFLRTGGVLMRLSVAIAAVSCAWLACRWPTCAAAIRKPTDIPAQALTSALEQLAKDRNFQVVYVSEDIGNLRTAVLSGVHARGGAQKAARRYGLTTLSG